MTETAIADHGLIGDLQTAALVRPTGRSTGSAPRGSIPRACSAPCSTTSAADASGSARRYGVQSKQTYFPDTAVLITRFFTADGLGQVVDFMPPAGSVATDNHRLVRMLRCVRGRMSFEVEVAPRFDYGRRPHRTEVTENGAVFTANGMTADPARGP